MPKTVTGNAPVTQVCWIPNMSPGSRKAFLAKCVVCVEHTYRHQCRLKERNAKSCSTHITRNISPMEGGNTGNDCSKWPLYQVSHITGEWQR